MKKLTVSDETHETILTVLSWEIMKARDNVAMGDDFEEPLRKLETAMGEVKAAETINFPAEIAAAIRQMAEAITPRCVVGNHDASGGFVTSLTEALMGVTASTQRLADAMADKMIDPAPRKVLVLLHQVISKETEEILSRHLELSDAKKAASERIARGEPRPTVRTIHERITEDQLSTMLPFSESPGGKRSSDKSAAN